MTDSGNKDNCWRRCGPKDPQEWFWTICGGIIVFAVFSVFARFFSNDKRPFSWGTLTLTGELTVNRVGEYEVFYSRPFDSKPYLTWEDGAGNIEVTQQRADGFIVFVRSYHSSMYTLKWTAKGRPKKALSTSKTDEELGDLLFTSPKLSRYNKPTPILDNSLFITLDFDVLMFGGRNLNLLMIDIRTRNGEAIDWQVVKDPDRHQVIKLDPKVEPYIEFEYRDTVYAIEFVGKVSPRFTLTKIAEPTLQMKPVPIPE